MAVSDSHLAPGSTEYEQHVQGELEHYGRIFASDKGRERLVQPVPPSWSELERRASLAVREATGSTASQHVVNALMARPGVRLLSLGSGPGGVEIEFAQQAPGARITCVDLNEELLALGRTRARELALNIDFLKADLNTIDLPRAEFDIVWSHAALHHVVELERLAAQIKRALRPDGTLVVVDVISANGYRMWPENRDVVRRVFAALPRRFRLNHTAYGEARVDEEIWEADTSAHSMECIRSQDIVSVFERAFQTNAFVTYFSISRRFFDTMYGPNYELSQPLDLSLLNAIWELDLHYLREGQLKPETYFGIYK